MKTNTMDFIVNMVPHDKWFRKWGSQTRHISCPHFEDIYFILTLFHIFKLVSFPPNHEISKRTSRMEGGWLGRSVQFECDQLNGPRPTGPREWFDLWCSDWSIVVGQQIQLSEWKMFRHIGGSRQQHTCASKQLPSATIAFPRISESGFSTRVCPITASKVWKKRCPSPSSPSLSLPSYPRPFQLSVPRSYGHHNVVWKGGSFVQPLEFNCSPNHSSITK